MNTPNLGEPVGGGVLFLLPQVSQRNSNDDTTADRLVW